MKADERVSCNAAKANHNACMLDCVILIQKPGSCNSHILPLTESKHFLNAVRVYKLCVIIQEEKVFALSKTGPKVIDGGIIKAFFPCHHMEIAVHCLHFPVIFKGFFFPAVILHHNKFQVPVG